MRQRAENGVQPVERMALSVEEAMDALNLGRPLIYRMMNSKQLGSIKVGGRRLIPMDAIRRFLDQEIDAQVGGGSRYNA